MFVTPAFAQAADAGGPGLMVQFMPFMLIFVIMYFLLIRPQQKRVKAHREMIGAVRRGDTIVTSGGIIGKITKVDEGELELQVADGVRIRVVRGMVSDVRTKGEPVSGDA